MTDGERQEIEWACSRLIVRYAKLVDEARWDEVAALYTADGRAIRPSAPDHPIRGREAILASFRDRPARHGRHMCTNVLVEAESATAASAESRILLFTASAEKPAPGELPRLGGPPLVGDYRDRLVRVGGDWLFAERHGSLAFRP